MKLARVSRMSAQSSAASSAWDLTGGGLRGEEEGGGGGGGGGGVGAAVVGMDGVVCVCVCVYKWEGLLLNHSQKEGREEGRRTYHDYHNKDLRAGHST